MEIHTKIYSGPQGITNVIDLFGLHLSIIKLEKLWPFVAERNVFL